MNHETEAAAPFPSKARRCVRLINCTGQRRRRSGFLGVQSAHPPLCAKKLSVDVSRKREGGSIDVQPGNPLTHSLSLPPPAKLSEEGTNYEIEIRSELLSADSDNRKKEGFRAQVGGQTTGPLAQFARSSCQICNYDPIRVSYQVRHD